MKIKKGNPDKNLEFTWAFVSFVMTKLISIKVLLTVQTFKLTYQKFSLSVTKDSVGLNRLSQHNGDLHTGRVTFESFGTWRQEHQSNWKLRHGSDEIVKEMGRGNYTCFLTLTNEIEQIMKYLLFFFLLVTIISCNSKPIGVQQEERRLERISYVNKQLRNSDFKILDQFGEITALEYKGCQYIVVIDGGITHTETCPNH